jgi:hypothetical protein
MVLQLGNDVFLINELILQQKLSRLKKILCESKNTSSIVLINVDDELPTLLNGEELISTIKAVLDTVESIKMITNIGYIVIGMLEETSPLLHELGCPTLAGWFLGYPSVYLSRRPSRCLSQIPLLRVSLSLVYSSTSSNDKPAAKSMKRSSYHSGLSSNSYNAALEKVIDIQTFTCPLSVYASLSEVSRIVDEAVEAKLNCCRQLIESSLLHLPDGVTPLRVNVERCTVTYDCVVL